MSHELHSPDDAAHNAHATRRNGQASHLRPNDFPLSAPEDAEEAEAPETRASTISVTCDCGETFTSVIYHAVNVTLEPELLYLLLAESLNVAVCPNCGRRAMSATPFVYHDMARGLFAYVYPNGDDLPDDERQQLLEDLRIVYSRAVQVSERLTAGDTTAPPTPRVTRSQPTGPHGRAPRDFPEPSAPPMQVLFGVEQLRVLVDSLLEPDQRLGKVTLTAPRSAPAQRDRIHAIAQRLAREAGCLTKTTDRGDEYAITIFGPRSRVGVISRALRQGS